MVKTYQSHDWNIQQNKHLQYFKGRYQIFHRVAILQGPMLGTPYRGCHHFFTQNFSKTTWNPAELTGKCKYWLVSCKRKLPSCKFCNHHASFKFLSGPCFLDKLQTDMFFCQRPTSLALVPASRTGVCIHYGSESQKPRTHFLYS